MQFDIASLELEDTATLTVQNARGDDDLIGADGVTPVRIVAYGSGSREAVKALHKAGQQAQLRMQALLRGKLDKQAAEAADAEQVAKLVALTKEIVNLPIAPADLYGNPRLGYITRQFAKFVEDDANFAKVSPNPSAGTSGT